VVKSLTLDTVTEILLKSAAIGGEVCRTQRQHSSVCFKPSQEPSTSLVALACSIVTSADLIVQETILECLLAKGLEECAIQAEEDTPSLQRFGGNERLATLYVDPIDGTLAYSLGCPGWEEQALSAGFGRDVLTNTREGVDQRFYGVVLGAFVPGSGIAAVCALPELAVTYHGLHGLAFRNGTEVRPPVTSRASRVAIGRRLLDPNGMTSTPFANAGLPIRRFNASSPGVLWQLLEGACTSYAGVNCGYDMQLASVIASAAGFSASDRHGNALVPNLAGVVDIVLASSEDEKERICDIMLQFERSRSR